jgi:hypothetical protein
MSERVMVVSGAFATHTTKLYNYYVCPRNWDIQNLKYVAVNYFNELKYLGEITSEPFEWDYNNETISGISNRNVSSEIMNDLNKFSSLFNTGDHYLLILKPIINNCCADENLSHKGKGAFTQSHRYFENLGDFLNAHQNINSDEDSESNGDFTSINDGDES